MTGPSTPGRLDEDAALRTILEGTATETGEAFFRALVRSVCKALGTHGAWVTEYLAEERRLRSLAFWLGDEFVVDYEYALAGTPCEPVIDEVRLLHIPDKVVELFPRDPDLHAVSAVSYLGVPLLDLDGRILGHLAVLDTRPMPEESRTITVFRIFAERAAAELRRLRAEAGLRRSEATLRRVVDGAMDAIVELDSDLRVSHANPAAESAFGFRAEQVLRRDFRPFLDEAARATLAGLVGRLSADEGEPRATWIAGGLSARRADGRSFPAEATLSRTLAGDGAAYFTLVLRDVNERVEAERRIRSLLSEAEYLREELAALQGFDELVGRSPAMLALLREVHEVADTEATVLIAGETGTGKELVARAIHSRSRRQSKPLIKVNCAAIPESLMESEFFGHEAGAFTGATRRREGRFVLADGGTLLLDEIGDLPLALQAKLLRVLQEGEFEPVGSSKTIRVSVRVLAASNRDLQQDVSAGRFRQDLYYRLAVLPIRVPPLRERGDDVHLLAETFVARYAQRARRVVAPLSSEDRRKLAAYEWPGNVRELQNVIERAVITARGGRLDLDRCLPAARSMAAPQPATAHAADPAGRLLTAAELRELEKRNTMRALEAAAWKVAGQDGAAARLGVKPSTLTSRMKALGIRRAGPTSRRADEEPR